MLIAEAVLSALVTKLGDLSKVAAELRAPVQTVHSWKKKSSIPPWRRPAVLDLARRKNVELSALAWAYLADVPVAPEPNTERAVA